MISCMNQYLLGPFTLLLTTEQYRHLVKKNRSHEVEFRNRLDTGANKSIWNNFNQVWIDRNLARHGSSYELNV